MKSLYFFKNIYVGNNTIFPLITVVATSKDKADQYILEWLVVNDYISSDDIDNVSLDKEVEFFELAYADKDSGVHLVIYE